MNRSEAIRRLQRLKGKVLQDLAQEVGVYVRGPSGRVNKGWAGHAVERYLGLPLNSFQSPDFGFWELKTVSLKYLKNNQLVFKETMAITMIDPDHVASNPFEESHLKMKLDKVVVMTRVVGEDVDAPSVFHSAFTLDLKGPIYDVVKEDYNEVRNCLNDSNRGFNALTGNMGTYVQPRTKGRGHGSTSRAFYARKEFLKCYTDI